MSTQVDELSIVFIQKNSKAFIASVFILFSLQTSWAAQKSAWQN